MLSATYPDYDWLPWKFSHCPPDLWLDFNICRKFMDHAATQIKIASYDDWYNALIQVNNSNNVINYFKEYRKARGQTAT